MKRGDNKAIGLITLAVCAAILIAGLWPFNFRPANEVDWLANGNGIRFHGQGMVLDEGLLDANGYLFRGGPASVELWLRPDSLSGRGVMRILSVSDGTDETFSVGQWKSGLVLLAGRKEAGIGGVFSKGVMRFVTLTAGPSGTSVYLEGSPARSFSRFAPSPGDMAMAGFPILGNSPSGDNYWTGAVYGLAVYDRVLSPDEVSRSYLSWKENGEPAFPPGKGPVALYLFDEHAGTAVHNHQGTGHQLVIPSEFKPLVRAVLVPPWRDFKFNRAYISDIVVNLAGFVPFGFFVSALLLGATHLTRKKAIIAAVLIGAGLSLSIELTQAFIPGRDSQLSDVIDNTLGTVIGAMSFTRISRSGPH